MSPTASKRAPARGLKPKLGAVWRWSWIVTLPVTVTFLYWANATAKRYWDFGVRFRSDPFPAKLSNIGRMEFRHLIGRAKDYISLDKSRALGELPTVDLFLETYKEQRLDSDLPYSGKTFTEAQMLFPDDEIYPVQVRYRGDFAQHWGHFKKSFRIKTRKSQLFQGMRSFNLIVPKFDELLNNHLSYLLAERLGLMAPRSEMVFLRVNTENRGIFMLTEQLDESTLRRLNRMPGDLYSGELIGLDYYPGADDGLFQNAGLWDKIAVNNHFAEESRAPLAHLLDYLGNRDIPHYRDRLFSMLDAQTWGRFSLFELLTQSFHFDTGHNWRLYYDPNRECFEPVIWDPVGWHPSWRAAQGEALNLDIRITPLHDALTSDYRFLYARHRAVRDFYYSGQDRLFLETVREQVKRLKIAVAADPNMASHFHYVSPKEARSGLDRLLADIERTLAAIRLGYLEEAGSIRYARLAPNRLAIEVDGRAPVDFLRLTLSEPPRNPPGAMLAFWQDGQRHAVDVSGALSLQGRELKLAVPLLARHEPQVLPGLPLKAKVLAVLPAYYELTLTGLAPDSILLEIAAKREREHLVDEVASLAPIPFENGFAMVQPHPQDSVTIWAGEVTIAQTIEMTQDLLIKPGTRVRFAADASLICRGRVTAEGTPDQPIAFSGTADAASPWGVFTLKGKGAAGSRFRNCTFSGGSGYKGDLFEYSAMFSIHDVPDVLIRSCVFQDSHVVDDMVHAVYSDLTIEDSVFANALFDALDLDLCSARISACSFLSAGNDGMDLMGSDVTVHHSRFRGNRDKGISVGEGSRLMAVNNYFIGNQIGVQAKDRSQVVIYNAEFKQNQQALHAYKKNWRYGEGGEMRVYKAVFEGNEKKIEAGGRSRIDLYDCFLAADMVSGRRVRTRAIDQNDRRDVAQKARWLMPAETFAELAFFRDSWRQTESAMRGTHGIAD